MESKDKEHPSRAWARKMGKRPDENPPGIWVWYEESPNKQCNSALPTCIFELALRGAPESNRFGGMFPIYPTELAAMLALESAWSAIATAIGLDDLLRAARKEALDRAAKLVRSKMPHPGGYPGKCLCPICGDYNRLAAAIEALPDEPESADPGIDLKE